MDIVEAGNLVVAAGYQSPWLTVGVVHVVLPEIPRLDTYYLFEEKNTPPNVVFVRQSDRAVVPWSHELIN